jgi:hypothetical protein
VLRTLTEVPFSNRAVKAGRCYWHIIKDFTNRQCKWKHYIDDAIKAKNRNKSRIRARVEHSIGVIKRVFGLHQSALSRTGEER